MVPWEWQRLILASKLSPTTRLVALTLSVRMNSETGECWPGAKRIASDSGLSVSTVRRGVAELKRAGYLWVVSGKKGGTNLYRAQRPPWLKDEATAYDVPGF